MWDRHEFLHAYLGWGICMDVNVLNVVFVARLWRFCLVVHWIRFADVYICVRGIVVCMYVGVYVYVYVYICIGGGYV